MLLTWIFAEMRKRLIARRDALILAGFSDSELKDIGIGRGEILAAIRGELAR